jgi:hypothetical protein
MKREKIFVGWISWKYIFMKKNVKCEIAFQIHNNSTHHRKLFYDVECAKLSKEGDLWC